MKAKSEMVMKQTQTGKNPLLHHNNDSGSFGPQVGTDEHRVAGNGTCPRDVGQKASSHSTGTADGTVQKDTDAATEHDGSDGGGGIQGKKGTGGPGVRENGLAPEDEGVRMDSPPPDAAEGTAPKDKGK